MVWSFMGIFNSLSGLRSFCHRFKGKEVALSKEHWTLEVKALRDFSKSETKRDRKKSYKHYLYIPKKYTSLPNEKGVAQYLGLPRPI